MRRINLFTRRTSNCTRDGGAFSRNIVVWLRGGCALPRTEIALTFGVYALKTGLAFGIDVPH